MVEDKIEGLSILLISRTDKIVNFLVKTIYKQVRMNNQAQEIERGGCWLTDQS